MRILTFLALILSLAPPIFGQEAEKAKPGLPNDPREILAAAAPFYDFTSPELKPWHLKATYQLYDEKGKPSEQGTFEYWWASPLIHKSSWTRPSASQSESELASGMHEYRFSGEPLKYSEYKLQSALVFPLPAPVYLDLDHSRLDRTTVRSGKTKLSCIMVVPPVGLQWSKQILPLGLFPTYCFDPQLPVLRASYSLGSVTTGFDKMEMFQGRYLPHEVMIRNDEQKILTAEVESITTLEPSDPDLKELVALPAANSVDAISATSNNPVVLDKGIALGKWLVKHQAPLYPPYAKQAGDSGTVVLQIRIGRDGGIRDLRIVKSTPSPSLAAAALWAVSHWEYKPYMRDGVPVEVETTVYVTFTVGG
jgi:TonB family protein